MGFRIHDCFKSYWLKFGARVFYILSNLPVYTPFWGNYHTPVLSPSIMDSFSVSQPWHSHHSFRSDQLQALLAWCKQPHCHVFAPVRQSKASNVIGEVLLTSNSKHQPLVSIVLSHRGYHVVPVLRGCECGRDTLTAQYIPHVQSMHNKMPVYNT